MASEVDSCGCEGVSKTKWIGQLLHNNFNINDPDICYPAFPEFARKVYNWGDRTFNSYDSTYVVGTGMNWKLVGKNYNWMETTSLLFPSDMRLDMHSTLYSDAGFSLSFMAVSIGYMWNLNDIFSGPTSRHTFDFAFTTSRFMLTYQALSSTGGMVITRFGDYNDGRHIHLDFNDYSTKSKTLSGVYFFNNFKYSHAAAYAFSKYQLRSAGTPLVGFNLVEQRLMMNFNSLPEEMHRYLPIENHLYRSHYRSYNLTGGYSFNWVLNRHRWLINAFGTLSMGYRQVFGTREDKDMRSLISNNFQTSIAAVYNHRALFASANFRMMGYLNYNSSYTHFNAYPSLQVLVGVRFDTRRSAYAAMKR